MSSLGPVRELIKPKERDGIAVDRDHQGDDTDEVHHEARLHHVCRLHAAVPKHDGVGGCGYGQGEGIGADNS